MFAGLARWIGFLTMAAGATAIILRAVGFGWFIFNIAGDEVTLDTRADGIVALTGAAARIPDAIELLATDRGKRLLITGVHRATSSKEIARLTPLYSRYFTCCIDLDRSALNTFGNALEPKRWARAPNFNSMIVVTSNWRLRVCTLIPTAQCEGRRPCLSYGQSHSTLCSISIRLSI